MERKNWYREGKNKDDQERSESDGEEEKNTYQQGKRRSSQRKEKEIKKTAQARLYLIL